MLIGLRRYARSQLKELAISYSSPEMQAALSGKRRRRKKKDDPDGGAGDAAGNILHDASKQGDPDAYDISKAEKITCRRSESKLKRYAMLGGVILGATCVIGAVEYHLIFREAPVIRMPTKTFEGPEEYRTWTDASGKFSVEAKAVEIRSNKVFLETKDKQTVSIELSDLTSSDVVYVESLGIRNPFVKE